MNSQSELNRWVVAQRDGIARAELNPWRPYAYLHENERAQNGEIVPTNTVFLTNRECPWKCLMCDLWRNTLQETVPDGAIAAQIDFALSQLPPARQLKLYNSGSFFDARAIPPAVYSQIAPIIRGFERVIVESHPLLLNENFHRWRALLGKTQLEVALGLETIHPVVGPIINKNVSPAQFARAAQILRENDVALRVFVLVGVPFLSANESLEWTRRSIDFAFDCGASVVAIIPTRTGNGALDRLQKSGEFAEPTLQVLAEAHDYSVGIERGRVFADSWDLQRFSRCEHCFEAREKRLMQMNLTQQVLAPIECEKCAI